MADLGTMFSDFLNTLLGNPMYVLLVVGGFALIGILILAHRIHKIRSEEIFVHQAWGANWKGR